MTSHLTTAVDRAWRFARATAIGTSHVKSGTPCQDASACETFSPAGASTFIGVVSDGAGSAPLSQIGSRYACQIWREEAAAALERGGGVAALDREFALRTLQIFQHRIARVARHVDRPVRHFACTLLFAAVDENAAVFAQVGDGAIVVSPEGPRNEYFWVFWPQGGEYCNQTFFATQKDASERLQFALREGRIDELALFSDGLQELVLDTRRKVAHERFFEPMFRSVRFAQAGLSDPLSRSLDRFLRSRTVESRTDDDKSLILASRRMPEPRAPLPTRAPAAAPSTVVHEAERQAPDQVSG